MYDFCLSPIYAFLLALGGLAGYLTKGSTASLGAQGQPGWQRQQRTRRQQPEMQQQGLWVGADESMPLRCLSRSLGAYESTQPRNTPAALLLVPGHAGGGVGSAVVLSACTYASLQAYHRGQLCRPATVISLGEWMVCGVPAKFCMGGQAGWLCRLGGSAGYRCAAPCTAACMALLSPDAAVRCFCSTRHVP